MFVGHASCLNTSLAEPPPVNEARLPRPPPAPPSAPLASWQQLCCSCQGYGAQFKHRVSGHDWWQAWRQFSSVVYALQSLSVRRRRPLPPSGVGYACLK